MDRFDKAYIIVTNPISPSRENPMRNPPPQLIRLKDYAPPDFLIDSVELSFSLHKTQTRVRCAPRAAPQS